MRRMALWAGVVLIILLALSLNRGAFSALAQSGSGYDLTWNTIDGGGGSSSGGSYTLGGTIGQPDAGVMNGGSYTLVGGFWSGATARHNIYLPLILKID